MIYNELGKLLPDILVIELTLAMAAGGVLLCVTVAKIVHEYNSTQENEDKVCELLSRLCAINFKNSNRNPDQAK